MFGILLGHQTQAHFWLRHPSSLPSPSPWGSGGGVEGLMPRLCMAKCEVTAYILFLEPAEALGLQGEGLSALQIPWSITRRVMCIPALS